jgi:RHS repeat-associated protein
LTGHPVRIAQGGPGHEHSWHGHLAHVISDIHGRDARATIQSRRVEKPLLNPDDAEGHRVEDTTPNRLFWYGASGKLLETTDAVTTNHDYIYFDGRRIARHDSSGAVYYLYDDANGSLRTATDASGTQLCWADYYPFGEPVSGTGCSVDSYQFAGLYADAAGEDGNYSAAQRRYNYSYYRWLSPDPAGLAGSVESNAQTWDGYTYAMNNPLRYTDTRGGTPQDRVNAAYKLVMARISYVHGGKNASPCVGALDCSGFTEAVFQADPDNTITALSTIQNAATQWGDLLQGGLTTTNLSQAQPGDAIFFKDPKTGKIVHVGIVVEVNKSYISFADEANKKAGARIDFINRAHTQWGSNEVFAGLGRPIESAPGRGQPAQRPQPGSLGLLGSFASWLEEVFFNQGAPSAPAAHVQSYLCGGPSEPQCAQ